MTWPKANGLVTRIIKVPPRIHYQYKNSDKFPLFQMIAKNVGIRRAKGEFVLATNIDILFSDELCEFLTCKKLKKNCLYRIDRHDSGLTVIPENVDWQERLRLCRESVIRIQGQFCTHKPDELVQSQDPDKLHTNACGDFTLLSREKWLELKGYPEFELWSIYIDGLLLHGAEAIGLKQVVLKEPLRIYHIEHETGWAKTQTTITERPSLDYFGQYIPLCKEILHNKQPIDYNKSLWGLADEKLEECVISNNDAREHSRDDSLFKATECTGNLNTQNTYCGLENRKPIKFFNHWLNVLSHLENRLYYRDQSAESLESLTALARGHAPTVIVELGTLSGMSTKAWTLAVPNARIHAVDLSFQAFWKANEYFPIDTSRITFHEQDILSMDFKALWSDSDRVLFFVDAHDLANVPIMRHVLKNALPYLPKDSLVVVDDIWFSRERLGPDNVQEYFDKFLLGQIDELQCFTGHFAPYHKVGSFIGFREVLPLMDFVNFREIELSFEPEGKHVWFAWDGDKHLTQLPEKKDYPNSEYGAVEYNPLDIPTAQPLAQRIMPNVAKIYHQGRTTESVKLIADLINKEFSPEACYALAVCQARMGQLDDAHKLAQMALKKGGSPRMHRLAHDLDTLVGKPKVRMTGRKGLTIFAVPKAFKGHEGVIQKNAIRSWAQLAPKPEIILMGNDFGVREMALEVGAKHIPHIAENEYGTPLVDNIFKKAWDAAANDILAYVNADIILMDDFQLAVAKVINQFQEFLVIGQRWDLPVWGEIDFNSPEWVELMKKDVQENGFLHSETGLDYFIHPRGLWRGMPPFALGRTVWDNWLVKRPFEDEIPIIDGTGFITAVHQDHGYDHCQGGREGAWKGVEATRNRAMAGSIGNNCYTTSAKWMFSENDESLTPKSPSEATWQTDEVKYERRNWLLTQSKRLKAEGRLDLAKAYLEIASGT